jgi:galactokinase
MDSFTSIAPGRLCLFGEHQDYLGLPVIALAIPLECRIEVQVNREDTCRILELVVPQLGQTYCYDLDHLPLGQSNETKTPDFALAAIHEAVQDGWKLRGAKCVSTTTIPMQAGCSSSSAFCVAWCQILSRLAGKSLKDPLQLAQLAHRAEVVHFGHPGGTMDHVSSAIGGNCLRIGPGPWQVESLPPLVPEQDGVWVLADSGESKETLKHLQRCKGDRLEILKLLGGHWDETLTTVLNENQKVLLKATTTTRDTEREAAALWKSLSSDSNSKQEQSIGPKLGALMDRHHGALRDGLGLSTARLEAMRQAATEAGAWGFKLVGSGGGGCGVAWTPKDKAGSVAQAMSAVGAKSTWILATSSQGARIEKETGTEEST